jgi:hypothetical protein
MVIALSVGKALMHLPEMQRRLDIRKSARKLNLPLLMLSRLQLCKYYRPATFEMLVKV